MFDDLVDEPGVDAMLADAGAPRSPTFLPPAMPSVH
jgi:hypothetical protein